MDLKDQIIRELVILVKGEEMRIQVFTIFILLYSFCFGQSKLIGITREQNTGIKIPYVKVISNGASNSIASDNSGYFVLTFQDFKPGKNIIVSAEKDGWELVNEKEMKSEISHRFSINLLNLSFLPQRTKYTITGVIIKNYVYFPPLNGMLIKYFDHCWY